MPKTTAFIVNAFTKDNSGGSPTGVVLNAGSLNETQMQNIADQIGKSHTAFVIETAGMAAQISIRFFTPSGEIMNCGHGTIAAHYAFAKERGYTNHVVFQKAKEGLQKVDIVDRGDDIEIVLKQNEIKFTDVSENSVKELIEALRLDSSDQDPEIPVVLASPGSNRFLIGIQSVDRLNLIVPDFGRLQTICTNQKAIGCFVFVMAKRRPPFEVIARMFAPNIGIPEDIINGNSSGCLGAYLLSLWSLEEIRLQVMQGQYFNLEGVVNVTGKRNEEHIETEIGGRAQIMDELTVEY